MCENVSIHADDGAGITITIPNEGGVRLVGSGAASLMKGLQDAWMTEEEMARCHARHGEGPDWPRFYYLLQVLMNKRFIRARLGPRLDAPLLGVDPAPPGLLGEGGPAVSGRSWRLSRFTMMRREGRELLLESPLTPCRCIVYMARLAGLLPRLCGGCRVEEHDEEAEVFIRTLVRLNLAVATSEEGSDDAEGSPFWEFHDLYFHVRSHMGGHVYPAGAYYRFRGQVACPPIVKTPLSADAVPLSRPAGELLQKLRQPFESVLEARRSIRKHGETPVGVEELGALLFAAARLKSIPPPVDGNEISLRPSPSGGARHPFEIYPLVSRCEDLPAGLYHYCPDTHRLERMPISGPALRRLLENNPSREWEHGTPQVNLLTTARFGRTAWKYSSVAYRVVQLDLGCLYQTLYLVAAALGLAPCAIGAVEPGWFAAQTGIDPLEEPLIGGFLIGTAGGVK